MHNKILLTILFLLTSLLTILLIYSSIQIAAHENESVVYRLFNNSIGTHLYTTSTDERSSALSLPTWNDEGTTYYVFNHQDDGTVPVYRFFNTENGAHLYTTSEDEKNTIESTLPNFSYEGIKYYVKTSQESGFSAVHRFFNLSTGAHLYTPNDSEVSTVQALTDQWSYEGIVFYVNVIESGTIDLTNQVLSSTTPDCEAYIGTYTSTITDTDSGEQFMGSLEITSDGANCTITTNQIPNHDTGEGGSFAAELDSVSRTFTISANPTANASSTDLTLAAHAVFLNGVKWDAWPAACFGEGTEGLGNEKTGCGFDQSGHPWRYNVGSTLNRFGVDDYYAHLQPDGTYHYHATPIVLYDTTCEGNAISPVVGFAADGFPVFGPCFEDDTGTIRKAESSYSLQSGTRQDISGYTTPYEVGQVRSDDYNGQFIGDYAYVDGNGDLDECNGMTVDGQYGYYITDEYPYVLSCFKGTPDNSFR